MSSPSFSPITSRVQRAMRQSAFPDAPWNRVSAEQWAFLEATRWKGVGWEVKTEHLLAYLQPPERSSLATRAAHQRARDARNHDSQVGMAYWETGIGLTKAVYLGSWSEENNASDEREKVFSRAEKVENPYAPLLSLMTCVWPDMPALAWENIKDRLLVHQPYREGAFYAEVEDFVLASVDFAKAFRYLSAVNKLSPQVSTWTGLDVEAVIAEPAARPSVLPLARRR